MPDLESLPPAAVQCGIDVACKQETPTELTQAEVFSLYKKGKTSSLENYRPISLLNTIYKIYAALILARLQDGLDPYLHATQYGFRKHKGTADAIHIIRKILAKGEIANTKTFLVLLDWEKAFDKITHEALF